MKYKIFLRLRRFGAFLIDTAIVTLILLCILPNNGLAGNAIGEFIASLTVSPLILFVELSFHLYAFIALIIWTIYNVVLESILGLTVGKFLMQFKLLTPGKTFAQRLLISSARNFLKLLPFNTFSCLAKRSFADRILDCELTDNKNYILPKITIKLTFDNTLKLLFVLLTVFCLFVQYEFDNLRHTLACLIFIVIGYRQYVLKNYNIALVFACLFIVYQPFFIIPLDILSPFVDIIISILLFISVADFKNKDKLIEWIKIKTKN